MYVCIHIYHMYVYIADFSSYIVAQEQRTRIIYKVWATKTFAYNLLIVTRNDSRIIVTSNFFPAPVRHKRCTYFPLEIITVYKYLYK